MSGYAKCTLCNKNVHYNQTETSGLIRHLTEYHPEQQFVMARAVKQHIYHGSPLEDITRSHDYRNKDLHSVPKTFDDLPRKSLQEKLELERLVPQSCSGEKADENLPHKGDFMMRHPRGRKMYYKTTMATWRPARSRVTCPECGSHLFPTVRSSSDKYTQSYWGTTWIMACWPFCFLPFIFTAPTKHHLHCSNCNAYLGLYDPNQEVIDVHPGKRNGPGRSVGSVKENKV